jgi:AraC-like DNA-binding protein
MTNASLDTMLDLLEVRLDAFSMCEIGEGWSLAFPAVDRILVHFVLEGEGVLRSDRGDLALRPGMVVVVPRGLRKSLEGPGTPVRSVDVPEACPTPESTGRYKASSGAPRLVIGCAALTANLGEGFGLFEHLSEPLAETAPDALAPLLFEAARREIASPGVGTRALIGAFMKQLLIMLLRAHLGRRGEESPLYLPLMHPQLGRAMVAIVSRPDDGHDVESLARLCGMSRSRFSHHFTATYGRSPMAFVQAARLRAGARLLRSTRLPVKAISANVGYASRSHFSRAFRAEYGVDPSAYRETPHQPAGDFATAAE